MDAGPSESGTRLKCPRIGSPDRRNIELNDGNLDDQTAEEPLADMSITYEVTCRMLYHIQANYDVC